MYSTNRFGTLRPRALPLFRGKPHLWFSGGIWRCASRVSDFSCNGRTPQAAYVSWTLKAWGKL